MISNNQAHYSILNPKKFFESVVLRYVTLLGSFGLGVFVAIVFLPQAVLFNGLFNIALNLLAVAALFLYVVQSFAKGSWADKQDFFLQSGMPELAAGFSLGAATAAQILALELLAPGAIMFAATTVIAIFSAAITYVILDRAIYGNTLVKGINRKAPGILLTFLAAGMFFGVFSMLTGITGTAIIPFVAEIFVAGCLSLTLLNDIHSVIHNQCVKVLVIREGFFIWETKELTVNDNPAYCALLLFIRTIDLLITLAQLFVYASKLKEKDVDTSKLFTKIVETVVGCAFLFGMFWVIKSAFEGTFMRPNMSEDFRSASHDDTRNTSYSNNAFGYFRQSGNTSWAWS